jgi:YVTN family beta-propeller protein
MEFRILGRLEVVDENGPVALGPLKERLVLAVLLLHANEAVTRERLIDELWGESPPPTARKAVNVYISQVRKTLSRDGNDPIATEAGGYRLGLDPDQLDLSRMRHLLMQARECSSSGDLKAAAQLFREVLQLWRGPTLAGLLLESVGRHEIEQLDELRLTALMDRIDCDLALGHHEQVIGELNVLVTEHPLRERLRAQQMLALYRADRQADALDAYQQARQNLVDDLGIEPSSALQRLQQGILRHDPALEIPSGISAANGRPAGPRVAEGLVVDFPPLRDADRVQERPFQRRRSTRTVVLLGAIVAAGLAIGFAVAFTGETSSAVLARLMPGSLGRIDPSKNAFVQDVQVGGSPSGVAVGPGGVWTANESNSTVTKVDPASGLISSTPVGQHPSAVTVGSGAVWAASRVENTLLSIDPHPLEAHAPVRFVPFRGSFAAEPVSLTTEAGAVWIASNGAMVTRFSPVRNRSTKQWTPDLGANCVSSAAGWIWVGGESAVTRIDPATNEIVPQTTQLPGNAVGISAGAGWIWVVTSLPSELVRIDPKTAAISDSSPLPVGATGVTVGAGAVWVTNRAQHTVTRMDTTTLGVIKTIQVGGQPTGVAYWNQAVWVSVA